MNLSGGVSSKHSIPPHSMFSFTFSDAQMFCLKTSATFAL